MGSHYHRQMNFQPVVTSVDASGTNITLTSETEGLSSVCTGHGGIHNIACLIVVSSGFSYYEYVLCYPKKSRGCGKVTKCLR